MAKTTDEKILSAQEKISKIKLQIADEENVIEQSKNRIKELKSKLRIAKANLEKANQQKIIETLQQLDIKSIDDLNALLGNSTESNESNS